MSITKSLKVFTPVYHFGRLSKFLKSALLKTDKKSKFSTAGMSAEHRKLAKFVQATIDALPKVRMDEGVTEAYWIEDSWERPDAYIWLIDNHDKAPVAGALLTNITDALTNRLVKSDIFNVVEAATAPLRIEIKKIEPEPISLIDMFDDIRALPRNEMLCVIGVEHRMRSTTPLAFSLNSPKNAHIGTAAMTGGGKTGLCRGALITMCILNDSASLSIIIIDPGRIDMEATNMRFLPHLACPIISDPDEAIAAIEAFMALMYERKKSVDAAIAGGYTWKKPGSVLLFIDEVAGILALKPEIMKCLIRIAQEGRKYGLHLWWATQRPTVDVINGHLRDNTPLRIAGPVTDYRASDIITGVTGVGCQNLSTGTFKAVRGAEVRTLQSLWMTTDDLNRIVPLIQQKYAGMEPGWKLRDRNEGEMMLEARTPLLLPEPSKGGREQADDEPLVDAIIKLVQAGETLDDISINFIRKRIGPAHNRGQEVGKERAKRAREAAKDRLSLLVSV